VGGALEFGERLVPAAAGGQVGTEAGWLMAARKARVRSLSARSLGSPAARASWAASAISRLVAGSSRPVAASSCEMELRRTSAASSAARAASTRACSRSSRPARQDTYTPTRIAAMMIRITLVSTGGAP